MNVDEIIKELESLGSKKNVEGMRRFGITSKAKILGAPKPELREIAKRIGKNQELSIELWESGIHEARILACMIAEPEKFTDDLMGDLLPTLTHEASNVEAPQSGEVGRSPEALRFELMHPFGTVTAPAFHSSR